jgi:hypothetical protein
MDTQESSEKVGNGNNVEVSEVSTLDHLVDLLLNYIYFLGTNLWYLQALSYL